MARLALNTNFDAKKHGFHFDNSDIQWQIYAGGPGGKALCGGMVYAALDCFLFNRPIPLDRSPPAPHTPLNDYIYRRQMHAHVRTVGRLTVGKILFPLLRSNTWFVESLAGEFDQLRPRLASSQPVPLFLVREGGIKGHHVLAIGGQISPSLGNPILTIYDPNGPDDDAASISVDYAKKRFTNTVTGRSAPVWQGFFVDVGYSPHKPPW